MADGGLTTGYLVDSFAPAHSPATLAGLTVHVARCPAAPFWLRQKAKTPMRQTHRGFCSGDVLLSHNLSSYYHRGCSVSLPCSEWERVVPLRNDHQRPEPGQAVSVLRTEKTDADLWRCYQFFKRTSGSLKSTYRKFRIPT